jgi:hypothetical protein
MIPCGLRLSLSRHDEFGARECDDMSTEAFHLTSFKIEIGSVIRPGNWGRMLRRYQRLAVNNATVGDGWLLADSGDCGQGFRLNATMRSDRMRPPVPTKAAGVALPA